jgi:hypothetical protein
MDGIPASRQSCAPVVAQTVAGDIMIFMLEVIPQLVVPGLFFIE